MVLRVILAALAIALVVGISGCTDTHEGTPQRGYGQGGDSAPPGDAGAVHKSESAETKG